MEQNRELKAALLKRWEGIKRRCTEPSDPSFYSYGAKGITICEEWEENFEQFVEDVKEGFKPELELDRIDPTEGYFKENVQWLTKHENMNKPKREPDRSVSMLELMKENYIKAFDKKIARASIMKNRNEMIWHTYSVEGYNGSQIALIFNLHRSTVHDIIKQMPQDYVSPWSKCK